MEKSQFAKKFVPLIFIFIELILVSTSSTENWIVASRFDSEEGDWYILVSGIGVGSGKTWPEAQNICKSLNATLPIVDNPSHQRSFAAALQNLTSLTGVYYWIGAKASDHGGPPWRWLNGSNYTGTVDGGSWSYSRSYAYIYVNRSSGILSQPSVQDLVVASAPNGAYPYICQFAVSDDNHNSRCLTIENTCYVVYSGPAQWFSARNNCLVEGGDLATFKSASILDEINTEIAKYNVNSGQYWIGLQSSWWNWINATTDDSTYVTFSNWNNNQPDGIYSQCVSTDYNDGQSGWRDWPCNESLPFICQVSRSADSSPTTRVTEQSDPTVAAPLSPVFSITDKGQTTPIGTSAPKSQPGASVIPLAVGIGVGVGVPLLIALIVVITVLVIKTKRKRKTNNTSRSMKVIVKDDKVVESSAEGNGSANQRPGEGVYAEVKPHADAYDNASELHSIETRPAGQGIIYSDLSFRQSYS